MSHISGLVAGGVAPSPFEYADVVVCPWFFELSRFELFRWPLLTNRCVDREGLWFSIERAFAKSLQKAKRSCMIWKRRSTGLFSLDFRADLIITQLLVSSQVLPLLPNPNISRNCCLLETMLDGGVQAVCDSSYEECYRSCQSTQETRLYSDYRRNWLSLGFGGSSSEEFGRFANRDRPGHGSHCLQQEYLPGWHFSVQTRRHSVGHSSFDFSWLQRTGFWESRRFRPQGFVRLDIWIQFLFSHWGLSQTRTEDRQDYQGVESVRLDR